MIGNRLRKLRIEKDLTQQGLADLLQASQKSVSNYENDTIEPDNKTLVTLADIFNVSTDYLLGRTNERYYSIESLPANIREEVQEYIDFRVKKTKK